MTGAFATKVRGDGLPVLAHLCAAYMVPNDHEVPRKGCLMIGKATVDIQTIRARVEAVTLSCVLPDGTSFERQVRGYFTGEDGTLGIPGKWQHHSGAWLGNLLAAMGIAAGGIYGSVEINKALGAALRWVPGPGRYGRGEWCSRRCGVAQSRVAGATLIPARSRGTCLADSLRHSGVGSCYWMARYGAGRGMRPFRPLRDRLSFVRFLGLALEDKVSDAKTVWIYRE